MGIQSNSLQVCYPLGPRDFKMAMLKVKVNLTRVFSINKHLSDIPIVMYVS